MTMFFALVRLLLLNASKARQARMGIFSAEAADGTKRTSAWSSDDGMKEGRKAILKMVLIAFGLITVFMMGFESWYFGSYFRQDENAYRLTVRILDLDSQYASTVAGAPAAILGPAIVQAANNAVSSSPHFHLGYQIADSNELSQFALAQGQQGLNASDYIRELINNQDVWAGIIINPNATVLATEAANTGSTGYDPRGSITFYFSEARNFFSTRQHIETLALEVIRSGQSQANIEFAQNLLNTASNAGSVDTLLTAATSNALTQPFGHSIYNLHPFNQLAAEAPTTAGAIYLIIFTFLISPIWAQAFAPFSKQITRGSHYFLKVAVPILAYFWISLMYSLVTKAFLVDFSIKYGDIGFFIYWIMNWVTMSALGLVMECALAVLGSLYMPFFLVSWVIFNVSVAFLSISDMDHFYAYGHIVPVWNSVDATKSIIFGTKNHLGQNFGVNLAWVIVAAVALVTITSFQRHKMEREEAQSQSEKKQ